MHFRFKKSYKKEKKGKKKNIVYYTSSFLSCMHTKSNNIRVPSNTHPSRLHEDEEFFSAHGTPVSRPQSIRATIQNFAGSYSRASALYVADNISIHPAEEDEEQLFKTMTS